MSIEIEAELELDVLRRCLEELQKLNDEQRKRVLEYLYRRFVKP